MEVYQYTTNDGGLKFGFRIFTNDTKIEMFCDISGFNSYSDAEIVMEETLNFYEWK